MRLFLDSFDCANAAVYDGLKRGSPGHCSFGNCMSRSARVMHGANGPQQCQNLKMGGHHRQKILFFFRMSASQRTVLEMNGGAWVMWNVLQVCLGVATAPGQAAV